MLGPVVAGLVTASQGPIPAFVVNAASFGMAALLVSGVRLPRGRSDTSKTTPRQAVAVGVRYIVGTPLVRGLMLVIGLVMMAAAIRTPLEPLLVTRTLSGPAEALGLAAGSWGLGMLLGSMAAPRVTRRWARERVLPVAVGLVGVSVLAASQATSMDPVYGLFLLAGFGNALTNVCYQSLLQHRTPDAVRGRVIAAGETVLDSSLLIGAFLAGWVGSTLGVRGGFAVAGVIFLGAGAVSVLAIGRRASALRAEPLALSP
jgi:predicted MFS family arabinose efflux permease